MPEAYSKQPTRRLSIVKSTNSSASSFPSVNSLPFTNTDEDLTEAPGYGVFDPAGFEVITCEFFGEGADDSTFEVFILGIKKYDEAGEGADRTWVPIAHLDITLSAAVGRDGGSVENENRYADTISVGDFAQDGREIVSPGSDYKALFRFNNDGYEQVVIAFKMGTATSGNAACYSS